MRRILSLLLAFLMICSTVSFPVVADTDESQDPGQFLKKIGIIKGDDKGDLKQDATLKREEAIAILIRMLGKEDIVAKIEKKAVFKDVDVNHWAANYVQYAKEQGYTNGLGDGTFGLGQDLNAKQFITFMLRALHHSADWSKEDIIKKAKDIGLLKDVDLDDDKEDGDDDKEEFHKAIKREDVFQIMKNTLYTNPKDANQNLIYIIGANENADYKRFEILKVAATAKQIKLTFNQDIDEKEIEAQDINQKVKFIGEDQGSIKVVDVEDKMLLLEVEKPMIDARVYKLQVEKIHSEEGLILDTAILEFQIEKKEFSPLNPNPPQTPAPAPNPSGNADQADARPFHVTNLITENLKDFKIKFSEKIDKTSLVDPQDLTIRQQITFIGHDLGKLKLTEIDDDEVILEIEKTFDKEKEYTIKIEGIRSISGKTLVAVTMKFKIARLEAPEVEEIKAIGPDAILIEFSEPIKEKGSVLISVDSNKTIKIEADQMKIDGRRVILTTPKLIDKETYEVEPIGFYDYEGKTHSKVKFKFTFDLESVIIKE